MAMQQLFHFLETGAFLDRNQLFLGRHDIPNQRVHTAFKTDVAASDDTDQVVAVHHRKTGDAVRHGDIYQFANRCLGRNCNRILHHATLELLDLADGCRLLLNGHVLVHDADTAFLSHGDGQFCLGNGIHGGRQKRNVEGDTLGQLGLQANLVGQHF